MTSLAQETQSRRNRARRSTNDERYSRQILFRGIGAEGQRKLAAARVAIVGCGATGSALAGLLARAGVGTLRIIDRDYVEPSNLQRQSLFDERMPRSLCPRRSPLRARLLRFNSQIAVEPKVEDLVPGNIEALLEGMSLILDGTDNFETRYLINDYAVDRSLAVDLFRRGRKLCRDPERRSRARQLAWRASSQTRPEAWWRRAKHPAFLIRR